jgi:hypothetical protein
MSEGKFEQPSEVSDVLLAFPASVRHLMPAYASIPAEFKRQGNPYVEFQSKWFFSGLKKEEFPTAKQGIDYDAAMRHLKAIQGSFEPKHEHKSAAVAFLASKWLDLPSA